jgi:hypothetical protein
MAKKPTGPKVAFSSYHSQDDFIWMRDRSKLLKVSITSIIAQALHEFRERNSGLPPTVNVDGNRVSTATLKPIIRQEWGFEEPETEAIDPSTGKPFRKKRKKQD